MEKSNTCRQTTLSGACASVVSTVIFRVRERLSSVHYALNRCMFLFTKRLKCRAFICARRAPGFMRALYYLTCSKRRNSPAGSRNPQPPSGNNSTKSPAPFSPQSTETDTNTATCREPSAAPQMIGGDLVYPGVRPQPSNLGRWCERCQDYMLFARLERIGTYADTAQYIPRCITCGSVLDSGRDYTGF